MYGGKKSTGFSGRLGNHRLIECQDLKSVNPLLPADPVEFRVMRA
jgi:hypothetical protein